MTCSLRGGEWCVMMLTLMDVGGWLFVLMTSYSWWLLFVVINAEHYWTVVLLLCVGRTYCARGAKNMTEWCVSCVTHWPLLFSVVTNPLLQLAVTPPIILHVFRYWFASSCTTGNTPLGGLLFLANDIGRHYWYSVINLLIFSMTQFILLMMTISNINIILLPSASPCPKHPLFVVRRRTTYHR